MKIIPLKCTSCGENLLGLANDIIYLCPSCKIGLEIQKDGLEPIKVFQAIPKEVSSEYFYLPYIVFEVDIIEYTADTIEKKSELKISPRIDYVFISAYDSSRASIYGSGDLAFTLKFDKQNLQYKPAEELYGCAKSPANYKAHLGDYILAAADRKVDVSGVDVIFKTGDSFILTIPFYKKGNLLRDAMIGIEILNLCVDNLDEITEKYY